MRIKLVRLTTVLYMKLFAFSHVYLHTNKLMQRFRYILYNPRMTKNHRISFKIIRIATVKRSIIEDSNLDYKFISI